MARNRMIKADFWADEKIGNISTLARLLFIGTWNFADDGGICRANEVYLRNNIFPYDDMSTDAITKAIQELCSSGVVVLLEYSGERYLKIKNFSKHQTINKPSKFRYIVESEAAYKGSLVAVEEQSPLKEKEKEKEEGKDIEEETATTSAEEFINEVNNFYGEYANVYLTKEQYNKLLAVTLSEKAINLVINDLSKNIEIGKENRYSEDLPNLHFERLKTYWDYRRKNPDKFICTNNEGEERKYNAYR